MPHSPQAAPASTPSATRNLARQIVRVQSLYILALPTLCGLLSLYGAYDLFQMGHRERALVAAVFTVIFFCPIVLVVLAEASQRKFLRWVEQNIDAIAAGEAVYRGAKVAPESEVITFELSFSVIVASFKIPSQMFIVGQHRTWPWRTGYTLLSFIFGWWGIPWGPIYTVQTLYRNLAGKNRQRLVDQLELSTWNADGGKI